MLRLQRLNWPVVLDWPIVLVIILVVLWIIILGIVLGPEINSPRGAELAGLEAKCNQISVQDKGLQFYSVLKIEKESCTVVLPDGERILIDLVGE